MNQIKVDCHSHTTFSFDGTITPEKYVVAAAAARLDAVVICDHDTIEGALAVKALNPPFRVIVSEEIMTRRGELIGIFLQEEIPAERSVGWTIDAIHEQGALVIVPHPFSRVVPSRIAPAALYENADKIDIIEVFNSRNEVLADEATALAFARSAGCATCAGSDGHLASTLGRAYVEMPDFTDAISFLESLRKGTIVCLRRTPLWLTGITFIGPVLRHSFAKKPTKK